MPALFSLAAPMRAARLFAIAGAAAIALNACTPKPGVPTAAPAAPAAPDSEATHPLTENKSSYYTLPNISPDHTPVRIGVILPFTSGTPSVKALAQAMLKSAQMALYESGNRDIILITADEAEPTVAVQRLLNQGAEVIVGPLYATSVRAIAHEARDHGVPLLSFSTDRTVAGDGVYLMGFLPEGDTTRVVNYALAEGHHKFAALVPRTAFGDVTLDALKAAVPQDKGEIGPIEKFDGTADGVAVPAAKLAKADADAVFIPLGGASLRAAAPALTTNGFEPGRVKILGTGQWNDAANLSDSTLSGAWFAGPDPRDETAFNAKFRENFGSNPPALAALAYDAVSLVAELARGEPYKRFTAAALTDPNGFSGADGIFRFTSDGTAERGLAVIAVTPEGFHVVDPAPRTFVKPGS
jgi:ABC-type branched-subunit amino acid transport system substrate-binding protein